MKKKIKILFALLFVISQVFAELHSTVDIRFELTSIVFRLANANEYVNNVVKNYAIDIDDYFVKYKNHPLISYTRELREHNEIAYDAVSGFTELLKIEHGKILLNPEKDISKFLEKEKRWNSESLIKYIVLLNDFYRKTNFADFYNRHRELYLKSTNRFDLLLANIHPEWFYSFFGKSLDNATVIVSLCNGNSNYSLITYNKDHTQPLSIVIGCSDIDSAGVPVFNKFQSISLIIHEFCHHFSNPIVDKYLAEFLPSANKIFPFVKDQLIKMAYGSPKNVIGEGINRLCTNAYFKEYPLGYEQYNIKEDELAGFIWMNDLCKFLSNFYSNRNAYPTFEDFIPQIEVFMSNVSDNIELVVKEYRQKTPRIVSIFPEFNSIVSSEIKEICVGFSHPMWNAMGIIQSKDSNFKMPYNRNNHWSDDKKTFIIPVKLLPNTQYGFTLPFYMFLSEETYFLKNDFEIKFKTK